VALQQLHFASANIASTVCSIGCRSVDTLMLPERDLLLSMAAFMIKVSRVSCEITRDALSTAIVFIAAVFELALVLVLISRFDNV
jgi:hypothetical protein